MELQGKNAPPANKSQGSKTGTKNSEEKIHR